MSKRNRLKRNKPKADPVEPSASVPMTAFPWVILGLLLIAFGVAGYLGWSGYQSGSVVGCGPDSGCSDVLSSRWSSWFGVPVSLFALPLYAVLFVAAWRFSTVPTGQRSATLGFLALVSGLMIAFAAVWFTALQGLVIGDFCPWCLTAHAAGFWASLLIVPSIWSLRPGTAWSGLVSLKARKLAVIASCIGFGLLAGGQMIYEPDTYSVVTMLDDPEVGVTEAVGDVEPTPEKPRSELLSLHGGRFKLKASQYPLNGRVDAGNYVVSLFDYTCHHCRDTHPHLNSLVSSFPDDLAVLSLPTPLNSDCNPLMKRLGRKTPEAHRDACHYASLSLAVFRLKPELWRGFDHWLFTGTKPPPVAAAVARATELVGDVEQLKLIMQDKWIGDQVQLAVDIYTANSQAKGQGQMPQLVVGKSIITGAVNDSAKLFTIVEEQFGLRRATESSE